jgi:hypothetical protein
MSKVGPLLDQIKELRATVAERDRTIVELRAMIRSLNKMRQEGIGEPAQREPEEVVCRDPTKPTVDSEKDRHDMRRSDVNKILS